MKTTLIFSLLLISTPIFAATPPPAKPSAQPLTASIEQAAQQNIYSERMQQEEKSVQNPFTISLYNPNYVLPAYYTFSPYTEIYGTNTPDQQKLDKTEFKGQISIKAPVWYHIMRSQLSLYAAFTELFYWQAYVRSPYFRETNYEPELFFSYPLTKWNTWSIGIFHQSNGRGGSMERSWNRVYIDSVFSLGNWMLDIRPWLLISKQTSSNLHNHDITHYLGNGRTVLAYKFHMVVFSLMARNAFESWFKRGALEGSISIPAFGHFSIYLQGFSGYGQSLIEYNHYTNSIGIGLALNNWL